MYTITPPPNYLHLLFPFLLKFLNFSYMPSTGHIGRSCLRNPLEKETVLSREIILAMGYVCERFIRSSEGSNLSKGHFLEG